jgi:uncharacterized protein YbaR (Trm112 family)
MDPRLLEIVACPNCRSALTPVPDAEAPTELRCTKDGCGLRYRVQDGVPVLLVDEAVDGGGEGSEAPEAEADGDEVTRAD